MARNEDDDLAGASTTDGRGRNSREDDGKDPYAVTADELRQFIERIEQLREEQADIKEQEKEVFAEAKGRGYDTKTIREVLKIRKKKPDQRAEEQAILDTYLAALGID